MEERLQDWKDFGAFIPYGPFGHKLFVKQLGDASASADNTLLLIHGFPESSYSYHAVVAGLLQTFDRIILFDMLGYGFSDKPTEGFTYSLFEQADTVLAVWKYFGIRGGHMLSHDMGDSVATEIVARHENGILPAWFSEGLRSLTFTNGSMVLELAELRITQKILLSNYGHLLKNLTTDKIFKQQVKSAHGNDNLSDDEIEALWTLNTLQNGHKKTYLTIKYLNDRKRFEKTRWLPALGQTKLPIHICWGDDDAVARIEMAHYLKQKVCTNATLTIMKGLGHFCQLGSPSKWIEYISEYYISLRSK
ncbi:MAG: pimeloyl-ACP methyl ester carboxylesterase [Saprospiraceae bacterium]|jgi:pimeloyl-ACP methyl ester carboxylesterase